jgi:hypothetical protein
MAFLIVPYFLCLAKESTKESVIEREIARIHLPNALPGIAVHESSCCRLGRAVAPQ